MSSESRPLVETAHNLHNKSNLDTDSWPDLTGDGHDAAFVVAGAKGSLLSDLRNAVESAIANGQTLDEFKAQFNRITEGWAHRGGKDWRAAIVYGTNLRMAHAAGRYQYQFEAFNSTGSWAAILGEPGSSIGHMVVVGGFDPDGRLLIRNLWGRSARARAGSRYKMEVLEFERVWIEKAVLGR